MSKFKLGDKVISDKYGLCTVIGEEDERGVYVIKNKKNFTCYSLKEHLSPACLTVNFKFNINQKVKTPFGTWGFVEMRAEDNSGIKYYVKTEAADKWYDEKQLEDI